MEDNGAANLLAEILNIFGLSLNPEGDVFSPIAIFTRADAAVQLVLLILLAMSVWSWAVIIERSLFIRRLNRKAKLFERRLGKSKDIHALHDTLKKREKHPMISVFITAVGIAKKAKNASDTQIQEQIHARVPIIIARELLPMSERLTSLATIGAIAPFIGLFGTVWGIMNSFQSIAITQETSLAAVAPGIAEALFATALGLFVAIPAVAFYNRLSGAFSQYAERLDMFASELLFTVKDSPKPRARARPAPAE